MCIVEVSLVIIAQDFVGLLDILESDGRSFALLFWDLIGMVC